MQEKIVENLKRCPHFDGCSQNFCPLDLERVLRSGAKHEVCRFMREAKMAKVHGREFVSGGTVMPDALLKFVPESNLESLNKSSQDRYKEIVKN